MAFLKATTLTQNWPLGAQQAIGPKAEWQGCLHRVVVCPGNLPEKGFSSSSCVWNLNSFKMTWGNNCLFKKRTYPRVSRGSSYWHIYLTSSSRFTKAHGSKADMRPVTDPCLPGSTCRSYLHLPCYKHKYHTWTWPLLSPFSCTVTPFLVLEGLSISIDDELSISKSF